MDNNEYRIDVHVNDNNTLHYGDFALGVLVGTAIIPAIYGIYSKVKKLTSERNNSSERKDNKTN